MELILTRCAFICFRNSFHDGLIGDELRLVAGFTTRLNGHSFTVLIKRLTFVKFFTPAKFPPERVAQ
jgi:hypothetical protein